MALSVIRDILWRDVARVADVTVSEEAGALVITISGAGVTWNDAGKPRFVALPQPEDVGG
jgi:hypothetical protein